MSFIPLIILLGQAGFSFLFFDTPTIHQQCGVQVKVGYAIAGCYQKSQKQVLLNTDYSWHWKYTIPHEYAHHVTLNNPIFYREIWTYFDDEEQMADAYAEYWNDRDGYTEREPQKAEWFKKF